VAKADYRRGAFSYFYSSSLYEHGVQAAKDVLTVEEYHRVRNHLEDSATLVRPPRQKFAEQILK